MTRVLVLGKSVPALAAALDLAELGIEVHVAPGTLSVPQRGVPDPSGAVASVLEHVAAPISAGAPASDDARPELTRPQRVNLRARGASWKPQPVPDVWGVPAVPISSDTIGVLGTGAAMRAYLDRVKPVLTIGKQTNLGKLIQSRLGRSACELLAEPFIVERFGVRTDEVDVAVAAPGLNESLTVAGSLSGAVLRYVDRHVARETLIEPAGGWEGLVRLLLTRLGNYGATELEHSVSALDAGEAGVWIATDDTGRARDYSAVIVARAEEVPAASVLRSEIAAREPEQFRVFAVVDVSSLGEVDAQGAVTMADAAGETVTGSLELIDTADFGTWAVRTTQSRSGEWTAVLSGPVTQGALENADDAAVRTVMSAAGLETTEPARMWREPAPHARVAQREAADEELAAWQNTRPTVVLADPTAHGGELGLAIGAARERAVQLRRRLTGITD